MHTYTLGFSPCPNDTFIFDALIHGKIDTGGMRFEAVPEDVETLNQWALGGKLHITKLSFPALFRSLQHYTLLNAGSALGKGVGPLLIKKPGHNNPLTKDRSVAIPGINTTANLLVSFAYPELTNKKPMLFSSIEDAVLQGETDLGVIIHENRFTYQQRGLEKVADLGEIWESKMKVPIPLGGIAVQRSVDPVIQNKINSLIQQSLQYAFTHYPFVPDFVKEHAQAMSEEVMRKHIDLYVNNYSLDLGTAGRQAIEELYKVFTTFHQGATEAIPLFLSDTKS